MWCARAFPAVVVGPHSALGCSRSLSPNTAAFTASRLTRGSASTSTGSVADPVHAAFEVGREFPRRPQ